MTRLLVVIAISGIVCAGLPGCTGENGPATSGAPPRAAGTIDDGAPKFFVGQIECPVCGGVPIKAGHHVEVDGERLYFDRAECVDKFRENRRKYIEKYCNELGLSMPDISPVEE